MPMTVLMYYFLLREVPKSYIKLRTYIMSLTDDNWHAKCSDSIHDSDSECETFYLQCDSLGFGSPLCGCVFLGIYPVSPGFTNIYRIARKLPLTAEVFKCHHICVDLETNILFSTVKDQTDMYYILKQLYVPMIRRLILLIVFIWKIRT